MYGLRIEHSFDSAHFLKGYEGKCANIHGHRWRVEVYIKKETLINEGQQRAMIVDFKDLKKDVKEIIDYYDHSLIIEKNSLKSKTKECLLEEGFRVIEVEFRPTAESFSEYFYKVIQKKGYDVEKVVVFETPNNCALYYE
ncbi:6-carboxytetrahydropterin synthase QueD [Abyssisolibacter fermentans]|uniref:6-carboxytetrahydropterin synthase QueD n=1 Tax=Abyssisolibacter fermentans TaxID=1766203 RepID=UPI000831D096|nr:6-carboxytetrahydropterin synthase QueD [Abyssisolibacter fermentans]